MIFVHVEHVRDVHMITSGDCVYMCCFVIELSKCQDSLLVRAPDSWWKGCEFKSQQEWSKIFLLQSELSVPTFIRCPFTPVLPQWHLKKNSHSVKSSGGRLHLNMLTPLTQQSRCGLTMLLSRHSVGIYPETNSQATCQGTFGHSHLNWLSHCGLILA